MLLTVAIGETSGKASKALESYAVTCAHGAHMLGRATNGSGPNGGSLSIWLAALPP